VETFTCVWPEFSIPWERHRHPETAKRPLRTLDDLPGTHLTQLHPEFDRSREAAQHVSSLLPGECAWVLKHTANSAKWMPGVIIQNSGLRVYDVRLDSGDTMHNVLADHVRRHFILERNGNDAAEMTLPATPWRRGQVSLPRSHPSIATDSYGAAFHCRHAQDLSFKPDYFSATWFNGYGISYELPCPTHINSQRNSSRTGGFRL